MSKPRRPQQAINLDPDAHPLDRATNLIGLLCVALDGQYYRADERGDRSDAEECLAIWLVATELRKIIHEAYEVNSKRTQT